MNVVENIEYVLWNNTTSYVRVKTIEEIRLAGRLMLNSLMGDFHDEEIANNNLMVWLFIRDHRPWMFGVDQNNRIVEPVVGWCNRLNQPLTDLLQSELDETFDITPTV